MTAIDPVTREETTLPAGVGDERLMAFHFDRHTVTVVASICKDIRGDVVVRLSLVEIDGVRVGDVEFIPAHDASRFERAWEILFAEAGR